MKDTFAPVSNRILQLVQCISFTFIEISSVLAIPCSAIKKSCLLMHDVPIYILYKCLSRYHIFLCNIFRFYRLVYIQIILAQPLRIWVEVYPFDISFFEILPSVHLGAIPVLQGFYFHCVLFTGMWIVFYIFNLIT